MDNPLEGRKNGINTNPCIKYDTYDLKANMVWTAPAAALTSHRPQKSTSEKQ